MKRFRLLGLAVWALWIPLRLAGQATPYVALDDRVYQDLDALVDAGWVRGALLGERPWSRLTAARYVAEARVARVAADSAGAPPARLAEALDRLERDLAVELSLHDREVCRRAPSDPGMTGVERTCPFLPVPRVRVRTATADATWADSRARAIPTSYDWESSDYIDADLNPLLDGTRGRVLADGGTFGVEGLLDFQADGPLAAQLHPRVWAMDSRLVAAGTEADATLLEGYARALLGNLAVEIGRNHVALGHGRDAGPLLSDNARGLDLLRLSLERPARLPWKLAALGTLTASALIADMGGDQDTPHSKLIVFDGVLRPHRMLELSAVLLNHQGGENSPSASFLQRLQDVFLIYPQGAFLSDKVIGGGVALSVPSAGLRVYVDGLTTDDHNLFTAETGEALGSEAIWIGGARVTGIGPEARFDLWLEGRRAGVRPHTHHQFTSGLTLDRRLIGDALGPLARSLEGGASWRAASWTLALGLASDRYAGADHYDEVDGDGRFTWVRTLDEPDEHRTRVTLDWTLDPAPGRVGVGARFGYERVSAFAFTESGRSNAMLQLRLDYRR